MMGSVAAAATVAAMVWGAQPARSSQDWLAKAQSEFATKARDAVIQRRIGQGPEPAAAPNRVENSASVAAATPVELPATVAETPAPIETPVAETFKDKPTVNETIVLASATPETGSAVAAAADVALPARPAEAPVAPAPDVRDAAAPETTDAVASQPAEVAPPQPEPEMVPAARTTRRARPSVVETEPRAAAPKPRRAAKAAVQARAGRRSGSDNSIEAQGMRALRQHAPEIAAMVGRYM
jgi:ribonuclease E